MQTRPRQSFGFRAHASGLPIMYEGYDRHEAKLALSPDALINNYGRLAYPPGTCYEYSNIGFAALGAIASNLTGKDFGTLMRQRVLAPLGLQDSFFEASVDRFATAAVRYDPSGNPIPYYTIHTGVGRALRQRSRPRALCDVQL